MASFLTMVLAARVEDENGNFVTENLAYTEIERRLSFPEEGTMEVTVEKKESEMILILKTDCFARSVELSGGVNGEEFGWRFSDNFFDMLPGKEYRIRILGRKTDRNTEDSAVLLEERNENEANRIKQNA